MKLLVVISVLVTLTAGATVEDFSRYWSAEEIDTYLVQLSQNYSFISLVEVGTSAEGRNIRGVYIAWEGVERPLALVEAGLNAREWMSPMAACYILFGLGEQYYEFYPVLMSVNFLVIPLANPDGYEYSRTTDRSWQKSRGNQGDGCFGVNLNRNFDYRWNTVGGSTNPCSPDYVGPTAFSEPETQGLRDVMDRYSERLALYLSIQGGRKAVLYPYNLDMLTVPVNAELHHRLAREAALELINQNGYLYLSGRSSILQWEASGTSMDYMMGTNRTSLVFGLDLRGGGSYGYDLPQSELLEVIMESAWGVYVWAVHLALNPPSV